MAAAARNLRVRTLEREPGLCVVIEHCDRPFVTRMTSTAVAPERAAMRIVVGVTPDTLVRRVFERIGFVATRAGRCRMQAGQRERRQIMVERHGLVPFRLPMTCTAIFSQLPAVAVVQRVASRAGQRQ